MYYRPLFIALALSAILTTTPAAAVSLSGACEAVASVGYEAAQQRDAGVALQDSLAVVADYGKATKYYAAAVQVAYSSSSLTPEEIFYAIDLKCMGKEYVKREEFSLAPNDAAKHEAQDKAKTARLDAEWAARDQRAAAQRAIQAEVPAKPTFWESLGTSSRSPYSITCYTSSYGGKRYRSTYTRCY